jgi:hypothetical protein
MLPTPAFDTPPEPLQSSDESVCDQRERPGVHAFLKFVIEHQGGRIGRTVAGTCSATKSGHNSGRAWDWMIRADVPEERARADELLDWLLANDAEMFRRAGLSYIIWDRKVWSAMMGGGWRNYDGFDSEGDCIAAPCRNPHIDHVHFSFTVPGADGRTSFYKWLDAGAPAVPVPPPAPLAAVNALPAVAGFAIGLGASWWWATRR